MLSLSVCALFYERIKQESLGPLFLWASPSSVDVSEAVGIFLPTFHWPLAPQQLRME